MVFTELDGDQTRQLLNTEQLYSAFRAAQRECRSRFSGSMVWKSISGRQYLYRKNDGVWKGIGPRDEEREAIYERFHAGRRDARARLAELDSRIRRMAPVNRAMGLGRIPLLSARLLRRLDKEALLGHGIRVAGTHALYAYERMAGVHFGSEYVATQDIDLLYDARRTLKLLTAEARQEGLLGIIKSVDKSFSPTDPGSFRAANRGGYLVDLIQPAANLVSGPPRKSIGGGAHDLQAVEITGLQWLENSPMVEVTVLDEKGFPAPLPVPDPRAFALHKLWLSERDDRDPLKKRRDRSQARALGALLIGYLPHLRFEDSALAALPEQLRALARSFEEPPVPSGADWQ